MDELTPKKVRKGKKPESGMPDNRPIEFRVYLGMFEGKRRYKQFTSEAKALKFCADEKKLRKNFGKKRLEISTLEVQEYQTLLDIAKEEGFTLREAVDDYRKRLRGKNDPKHQQAIKKLALEYLAEAKAKLAPNTYPDRKRRILKFADAYPVTPITEAGSVLPKYLSELATRTSPKNADNTRRALSTLFTWGKKFRGLTENPCTEIGSLSTQSTEAPKIISVPEAKLLLKALKKDFNREVAGHVCIALFAGIRPYEFSKRVRDDKGTRSVSLLWEDIIDDEIRISTALSKTKKGRMVPVLDPLGQWVDWIRKQAKSDLSGPVIGSRFKFLWSDWRKGNAKKLPWASKDLLRHTFGTYRVSTLKQTGIVANEMGNSEAIVRRHYWDSMVSKATADQFWALTPEAVFGTAAS